MSRPLELLIFTLLVGAAPAYFMHKWVMTITEELHVRLAFDLLMASLAFVFTLNGVTTGAQYTLRARLYGKDFAKKGTPLEDVKVPESLGVVCGAVYVISVVVSTFCLADTPEKLVEFNAALHSISFILFLGFADDVLDIPWRFKLLFPLVSSLPLLSAYTGGTSILVPKYIASILGLETSLVDLGFIYKIYMLLLACFCTNAINILAGINGIEVGQSIIIGCSIVVLNLIELCNDTATPDAHFLSMTLILPFLGSSLGLLYWNWWPAHVFVGDTYTLFAGMTLAVAGILGHFSKTLLVFFLPQVINFVYSVPQLIGIIKCPRHRLPRPDPATGLLHGVPSHMNLINLMLRITGPLRERTLCIVVLSFQAVCCLFAFVARYWIGPQIF